MILFFISILSLGTKVFGLFPETDVFTKMRVFTEVLNNIKDFYVDEKNPNDFYTVSYNRFTCYEPDSADYGYCDKFRGWTGTTRGKRYR